MPLPVTGRCFCGAVRFQSDHRPLAVRVCWCRDCQYLSAGNASVNAVFKVERISIHGETGEYLGQADSGNTMRRRFCRECGTPLFSQSSGRPQLLVVRAGALDDPELAKPEGHHLVRFSAELGPRADGAAELRGAAAARGNTVDGLDTRVVASF